MTSQADCALFHAAFKALLKPSVSVIFVAFTLSTISDKYITDLYFIKLDKALKRLTCETSESPD